MSNKKPLILTIAGSDNTCGAGIQADITTISQLGCQAASVITAVTAQNPMGVHQINPMTIDVIKSQLVSICDIKVPDVIKIGLLANIQQVEFISDWLLALDNGKPTVVYDPVAIASNGHELTEQDILPAVIEKLFPLVDVITPNAQEAQKITGEYIISWDSLPCVARRFNQYKIKSIVLKGGHIDIDRDYCVDMLQHSLTAVDTDETRYWLASPKINTKQSHGTGCTFASALASFIGLNYHIRDAFILTKAYINKSLALSSNSPFHSLTRADFPKEKHYFPEVLLNDSPLAKKLDWYQDEQLNFNQGYPKCEHVPLGLYPVVNDAQWVERLLKLGVKTIQIRVKHLVGEALEEELRTAVELGKRYNAQLFVNDHWQLAISFGAFGVHLGQEDMNEANCHAIQKAGLRLGISTHGHYELLKMHQLQPSYLAIGAIFPTKTKDMTGQIQGLSALKQLVPLLEGTPVTAIGGITLDNGQQVLDTGVSSLAVVTAITEAVDPDAATLEFCSLINSHNQST